MKALTRNPYVLLGVCLAVLVTAFLLIQSQRSFGHVTSDDVNQSGRTVAYTFFATSTNQNTSGIYSTTTTATSTNITAYFDSNGRLDSGYMVIEGAERVGLLCERGDKLGGGNTGSTACRYQVSNDLSNWFYFGDLVSATSTDTVGATISIVGTTTAPTAMDTQYATWRYLRCIVVETTDGSHECRAIASWE